MLVWIELALLNCLHSVNFHLAYHKFQLYSLLSLFPTRDKKSTPEHSEPILRVTALSLMLTVAELISLKQKSIPTKVHLSNTTVQYESI